MSSALLKAVTSEPGPPMRLSKQATTGKRELIHRSVVRLETLELVEAHLTKATLSLRGPTKKVTVEMRTWQRT